MQFKYWYIFFNNHNWIIIFKRLEFSFSEMDKQKSSKNSNQIALEL